MALSAACSQGGYVGNSDGGVMLPPDLAGTTPSGLGLFAVTPSSGPAAGGLTVRLRGQRFVAGATVTIAGTPATQVKLESDTELTAVLPAAPTGKRGAVPVTVRLPSGDLVTRPDLFRYASDALAFATPVFYTAGSSNWHLRLHDVNKDEKPDILVANGGAPASLGVLLNQGNGSFGAMLTNPLATGGWFLAAADLNLDGSADVVVGSSSERAAVLLGKGDGAFQTAVALPTGGAAPTSPVLADFNKDGKLDLAVTQESASTVGVLLGNGDGTFKAPVIYPVGREPIHLAAADVTGDGKLDLVVAEYSGTRVALLAGNGDGSFAAATPLATVKSPVFVGIADLNLDGQLDVAVASEQKPSAAVILGKGGGQFAAPVPYEAGNTSQCVAIRDLNGDAIPDLAVASPGSPELAVLLGNGDGTFAAARSFPIETNVFSVDAADLDGDGRIDLAVTVVSSPRYRVGVLLNKTQNP